MDETENKFTIKEHDLESYGTVQIKSEELPSIEALKRECDYEPVKKELFPCEICSIPFYSQKTLEDHNLVYHNSEIKDFHIKDEMFTCEVCEDVFRSEELMEEHKLTHMDENSEEDEADNAFVCSVCNEIFNDRTELIDHKNSKIECHEHKKCDKCKADSVEEFSCIWELVDHFKAEHGMKDADGHAEYEAVKQHLEKHELQQEFENDCEPGKFYCDYCSEIFTTEDKLMNHKKLHSSESYLCEFCGKLFRFGSGLLDLHKAIHSKKPNPYVCSNCPMTFRYDCEKRMHERIHTGENPFKCETCDKSFLSLSLLESHQLIHNDNDETYSCNFCSKTFSLDSYRKVHEIIHNGEKKYSCNFCSKTFSFDCRRKVHERTHTGEKKFSCNFCSKTFSQNSNRNKHEKIHKGQQTSA